MGRSENKREPKKGIKTLKDMTEKENSRGSKHQGGTYEQEKRD